MSRKILLTTLAVFILNGFGYIYSQGTYRSHIITEEGYSVDETSSSLLESQEKKEHYNAYRTTWKKNRFRDTWFVTIGSGVQLLMAEDDSKGDFAKRLTYAPTISIGKYFSPIWGLRLNFTGGSLHGFNDGVAGTYRKWNKGSSHYNGTNYAPNIGYPVDVNFQTFDPQWTRRGFVDRGEIAQYSDGSYYWKPGLENKDLYMQHIRYAAVNLNFMFDFLTLIGDYNPDRAFEITPFGGVTYAHLFPHMGYEAHDVIGANLGLNARIRLTSKIDFNIEGGMNVYPDDFDGHVGGARSVDLVTQLTGGITYHIGKKTWDVVEPMNYDLIRDLNNKINDLRNQLDNIPPCPDCPPCPEVKPPVVEEIKFLPDPVFFRLDKSAIDNAEWYKIEKAVKYLRDYPEAHIVVTGYADRKTGSPQYNYRLSERRAKTVAQALVEKYNVLPSRISISWEGDKIQPFEINEWNRVVVFVIE